MKCAYEAANGVEAHMIANLLEQQRIHGRVEGEHLAGGVGDLPAFGLIRVMVNEDDFERAREIIREWEAASPPDDLPTPAKKTSAPAWFLLGVAVGAALMSWAQRARASEYEPAAILASGRM